MTAQRTATVSGWKRQTARRLAKANLGYYTGEPLLDLLAAVYRLALRDAQRGDWQAAWFLDQTAPEW